MTKIRYAVLLLAGMVLTLSASGQQMERLRYGTLDNGFTYYIKHSDRQKNEVNFYLLQNVGSILENDNENGLAHFLEHMAFNAAKDFPQGVMNYFRSNGVSTFNASTGQNDTYYNITNVPAGNPGLLDTCLLVLRNWCDGISLNAKDIEKERGIIIEEWRTGEGVARRLQDAKAPYVFNGSKYAARNTIGHPDLLRKFKPAVLRNFYAKWYRPDLQVAVVIGDIDEVEFEKKVMALFSELKMPKKPLERPHVVIGENPDPQYALLLEPDNKVRSMTLYKRVPRMNYSDDAQRRRTIMSINFFNDLVNKRFARLKFADQEEFVSAGVNFGQFVRGYNAMTVAITPLMGRDREAFEQVWGVLEQLRRNGFTDEEFDAEQRSLYEQTRVEQGYAEYIDNSYYFKAFQNHYVYDIPMLDVDEELQQQMETILELTVDDVNDWFRSWFDNNNDVVMIVEGNDPDYAYLTEQQFDQVIAEAPTRVFSDVERVRGEGPLVDFELTPGTLTAQDSIPRFGAEIWHLSNGARVIYKYTEQARGTFAFISSSYGGSSVVDASDLPSLKAMNDLVMKSGLYKFDRNQLQDIVGGRRLVVNLQVNELTEGIGGSAPTEYADMFFQFFHLLVDKQVFDRKQFDKYRQQRLFDIESMPKNPMQEVQDSIAKLTTKTNDRIRKFDEAFVADMEFSKLLPLYNERFGNAADFTYCIVGDIPRDEALKLACRYIGSLKSDPSKKENFRDWDFTTPEERIERVFTVDIPESKSFVVMSFDNTLKLERRDELALDILGSILRNRLFKAVREDQSGAYGVNANIARTKRPADAQTLSISFETARDKGVELKSIVYSELDRLIREGVTAREVEEQVISLKRDRERFSENMNMGYWLGVLNNYIEEGLDITSPDYFENIIGDITPEQVREIAEKLVRSAKVRDFVIMSEKDDTQSVYEH